VTRSGRSLNVSAPEPVKARATVRAAESEPQVTAAPRVAEIQREVHAVRQTVRPITSLREEPLPPLAEPAPAPRGGWLSDLLTRAGREDKPMAKPTVPALEKLDSLSFE
jgi:hypothetical protein